MDGGTVYSCCRPAVVRTRCAPAFTPVRWWALSEPPAPWFAGHLRGQSMRAFDALKRRTESGELKAPIRIRRGGKVRRRTIFRRHCRSADSNLASMLQSLSSRYVSNLRVGHAYKHAKCSHSVQLLRYTQKYQLCVFCARLSELAIAQVSSGLSRAHSLAHSLVHWV